MAEGPSERVRLSKETLVKFAGDRWSDAELTKAIELLERAGGRFPAGVRALPEGLVRTVQRARLLVAMVAAIAETDYRKLTVQDVLTRSGVSRPTFYEQFQDKEDCFLAAFDATAEEMRERVETAVAEEGRDWQERLRKGIEALLQFVAEEPKGAYLLIVGARASCPAGMRRRDELFGHFAGCMDALVRDELDDAPSPVATVGIVGGIESVLHTRLRSRDTDGLRALLPSLTHFAELAYRGGQSSGNELSDPAAV